METFVIHSIGDSAFLEQILIAVAMVTGTGDMSKMVSIGLLMGVIFVCVQSVANGARQIEFQKVLIGWIIYAVLFGPTSRVLIEDAYTGAVRPVDNVPIGVGMAGGVISNVGYNITNLFEAGYGVIGSSITEHSFAEPLKLLNDARRRIGNDNRVFSTWDESRGGGGVDIAKSWNNYIRECSLLKLDLASDPQGQTMNLTTFIKSDVETALRFSSSLYGTRIYLEPNNPSGSDVTCSQAWSSLSVTLNDFQGTAMQEAFARVLGIKGCSSENPNCEAVSDKIDNAMNMLGMSSTSMQDFMKAAILEPVYYQAAIGKYQDFHDSSSAVMLNQALMQRDQQWATESSMFMTIVRPMMTFFEGFVYAVTPIMAFLVALGPQGVQLAGKYVLMLLWIQLWMPVLSVINLYICMAAAGQMSGITDGINGFKSFFALSSAGETLSHWIGVGGLLASSTPAISMMLIYGSSIAATSMAGKLSGGDHVDEKINTPDVVDNGAVMNNQAMSDNSRFAGQVYSGASSTIDSVNASTMMSNAESSSKALQQQNSQAFSGMLQNGINDTVSSSDGWQRMSSFGHNFASGNSQSASTAQKITDSLTKGLNFSSAQKDAITGTIAGSLAGDGNALGGLAKLFKAGATSSNDQSLSTVLERASKLGKDLGLSNDQVSSFKSDMVGAAADSSNHGFNSVVGETNAKTLSQTASKVLSSTDAYNQIATANKSIGSNSTWKANELGAAALQSPSVMSSLNNAWQQAPVGGEFRQAVNDKDDLLKRQGVSDASQRRAAAIMMSLMDPSSTSNADERSRNMATGAKAFAALSGHSAGAFTGGMAPSQNANITKPDTSLANGSESLNQPRQIDRSAALASALQPVTVNESQFKNDYQGNKSEIENKAGTALSESAQKQLAFQLSEMDKFTASGGGNGARVAAMGNNAYKFGIAALGDLVDSGSGTKGVSEAVDRDLSVLQKQFGLTDGQMAVMKADATNVIGSSEYNSAMSSANQKLRSEFSNTAEGQKQYESVLGALTTSMLQMSPGTGVDGAAAGLSTIGQYNQLMNQIHDPLGHNKTTTDPKPRERQPVQVPESDVPN